MAQRSGVRVDGVVAHGGGLVFRAEGDAQSGIWQEDEAGETQLVLEDKGRVFLEPQRAGKSGEVLVVSAAAPAGAPSQISEIAFFRSDDARRVVPGQTVGISGDGRVAVVANVVDKKIVRVDLDTLDENDVAAFEAGMDPQLAPLIALDQKGEEALFMDAREERCDASLVGLNLQTGEATQLVAALPSPARIWAAFGPADAGIVYVSTLLGEETTTRLVHVNDRGDREIFRGPIAQPASLPIFIDEETVMALWSLKPHPTATYGPVDAVMFSLSGKTQVPLTQEGHLKGRLRYERNTLFIEGGHTLIEMDRIS
jgi:hypothetical protein